MQEKPNLICIDDEERILSSLKLIFRKTHKVYTTTSPDEFRQLLSQHHMHVIISDQRMPELTGTELLKEAATLSPNSMRILLTGYADLEAVVDSINEGEIFRYITKPWDNDELKIIVQKATDIALQIEDNPVPETPAVRALPTGKLNINKPSILFIFDSVEICQKFTEAFANQYAISCANTLEEVEETLTKKQFQVAITDVQFDGENITPLIYLLKRRQPELVTIVMTNALDITVLIDLINKGQIFRFLPKPVRKKMLLRNLEHAVARHQQLKSDSQQQLRYQVEETEETEQFSERFMRLSNLVGRLKNVFKQKGT